jgi:uncharacterized membrane protein HdeD (DUF308 family)
MMEIMAARQLRRFIPGEWLMLLAGIVSLIFAVILIVFPGEGAVSRSGVIGVYAIIYGALLIILGFRLRRTPLDVKTTGASPAARG